MRSSRLALAALAAVAVACGPASFPDTPAVVAAQASWCDALAKVNGPGWDHLATCKGAMPTGSAAYVRAMAKCFPARKEAAGDKAWDAGLMIAECHQEVVSKTNIDEAAAQETLDARCERAARCEKASVPECVAAAKRIEVFQRALLYGIYNGAALHQVADCLRSNACGADEYATQDACYKAVSDKLVWVPQQ
jgi:hypothetical protein